MGADGGCARNHRDVEGNGVQAVVGLDKKMISKGQDRAEQTGILREGQQDIRALGYGEGRPYHSLGPPGKVLGTAQNRRLGRRW